jgi:hypothetical protein
MTQDRLGNTRTSFEALRSRKWCFTWNNYTQEDTDTLHTYLLGDKKIKNYIVEKEVGESGTPHLQGYLEYNNAITGSSIRKQVSTKAHFEVCGGSRADNYQYCSKDKYILFTNMKHIDNMKTIEIKDKLIQKHNKEHSELKYIALKDGMKRALDDNDDCLFLLLEEMKDEMKKCLICQDYGKDSRPSLLNEIDL